jgi:phosphoribosylaminoimidazole carboxylase
MLSAAHVLCRFHLSYELTIVSAHPLDRVVEYSRSAAAQGLQVIVARAGGAAYHASGVGMVATMKAVPIIGVPVKGSSLDRADAYITFLC